MTRAKKFLAFFLVLAMISAVGAVSVTAATAEQPAAAESAGRIVIHARQDNVSQLYVYLWNSLPTNDAMSRSYPGDKMTKSNGWFNFTVENVTKVNALITDANGNQYSKEQKLTAPDKETQEWWCSDGKWTKYDPDKPDPVDSVDMREESIYFVMTTRFYDGDPGNNVHCWSDSQANNPDNQPPWRGG